MPENTNSQPTPAPWKQYAPRIDDEIDPYYRTIRTESHSHRGVGGFNIMGFISPADAKLIAAAPDLLEACKLAATLLQTEGETRYSRIVLQTLSRAIDKAILTAEIPQRPEEK